MVSRAGGGFGLTGLLCVAALLGAAPAGAAKSFPSKVELEEYDSPSFLGEVTSRKGGCKRDRKVVLFWDVQGAEDQRYGQDRTNAAGEFEITPPGTVLNESYYAIAPRKRLGDRRACSRERSTDLFVEGIGPPPFP